VDWSPQQDDALVSVRRWMEDGGAPVFRLFGFAGTGKTTLATHLADTCDGVVKFAAFTGKAASVMASKGCVGAQTIHSLIYRPVDDGSGDVEFVLDEASELAHADLLVVDEVSMVGEDLARDLLSFGVPVLVLGDPAQLPPVSGAGYFTEAEPDVMLTEIHRQARESPILRAATAVREGRRLEAGRDGDLDVVRRATVEDELAADQVLVGRNRSRHYLNRKMREALGLPEGVPVDGDRVVCLKNKRDRGLLNGTTWVAEEVEHSPGSPLIKMKVTPEGGGYPVDVLVREEFFRGREAEVDKNALRRSDQFAFGYALTVHKAQGSQWNDVLLVDESAAFGDDARRWLYTGITRAAKKLKVVLL
jgi:ATP-dependent exoDNAse (exonuclease V) alpha subunit